MKIEDIRVLMALEERHDSLSYSQRRLEERILQAVRDLRGFRDEDMKESSFAIFQIALGAHQRALIEHDWEYGTGCEACAEIEESHEDFIRIRSCQWIHNTINLSDLWVAARHIPGPWKNRGRRIAIDGKTIWGISPEAQMPIEERLSPEGLTALSNRMKATTIRPIEAVMQIIIRHNLAANGEKQ